MPAEITLRFLFDSKKEELIKKIDGMLIPKDNQLIQSATSDYLSILFDSEGEFRQNLTQAEDYLLQATMSLLTAQQELSKSFIVKNSQFDTTHNEGKECKLEGAEGAESPKKKFVDYLGAKMPVSQTGVGVGAGAVAGQLAFGGWGAVIGAIAGTAVMVYIASRVDANKSIESKVKPTMSFRTESINEPIDVQRYVGVVGGICDSVDNLISTFRVQVNRVIDKYESMEKPTIEKQYGFLLESIQTLIGYKRTHDSQDDKYLKKLQTRIEDLAECLENYNLTTEDYDGNNEHLFELIPSSETTEVKMAYPAIVRDGIAVLKGKIFTPVTK